MTAWRLHKSSGACTKYSLPRGVAEVRALLPVDEEYSDTAIELALKLGSRVPLYAYDLLIQAKTGGYIVMFGTSTRKWHSMGSVLKVLFGFKVRTKDFRELERAMGTLEQHEAKLREVGKEHKVKQALFAALFPLCDELLELLLPVLDCARLPRHIVEGQVSNAELMRMVHKATKEPVEGLGIDKPWRVPTQ